jgi:hypothetical protein
VAIDPASASAIAAATLELTAALRDCWAIAEAVDYEHEELESFVLWFEVPVADPSLVAWELAQLLAAILARDPYRLRHLREVEEDVATVRPRVTEWVDES